MVLVVSGVVTTGIMLAGSTESQHLKGCKFPSLALRATGLGEVRGGCATWIPGGEVDERLAWAAENKIEEECL